MNGTTAALWAHLKTICDVDSDRDLGAPFIVDVDGQPWTVGSDGKQLFAMPGDDSTSKRLPEGMNSRRAGVVGYITVALTAKDDVNVDSLRAFVGAPTRVKVTDCGECGGTGSICTCGECKCDNCDGKIVRDAASRPGWVNGRYCDLNRVAQLLAGVKGPARVLIPEDAGAPISFAGEGWIAVLMPLAVHTGDGSDGKPRWVQS